MLPRSPGRAERHGSLAKQNVGYAYLGTWYDEIAPYFSTFVADSARGEC